MSLEVFLSNFLINFVQVPYLGLVRVSFLFDSDAGRDLGQEEKGRTEDEMAGWHHKLDGHVFH